MPLTRKPAIAEQRIGDRATVLQVSNIRQRIEALEKFIDTLEKLANQTSFTLSQSNASTANLQRQISALTEAVDVLTALLTLPNGFVVLVDGELVTRELEAGSNITITNVDGADGNPVISSSGGGYPFLTTELDDDILTEDDHRIRVE